MSTFWIVGIVLNVTLTGLILYWLIKQGKPKAPDVEETKTSAPDNGDKTASGGQDAD